MSPQSASTAALESLSRADRVQGETIRQVYRGASGGLIAAASAGVGLGALMLYFGDASRPLLLAWMVFFVVQTLVRLALVAAYHRLQPPDRDWRRWARVFTLGALIGGVTWGVGSLIMLDPAHFDRQMLIILVICALIYGALTSFGGHLPALIALLVPSLVPATIWSLFQPDAEHWAFAGLSIIWIPTVAVLARNYSRSVRESLSLRYENIDLLEDLQRQKEVADQANIAKSRFLASASHDLRQPVHALGMFVGALRAQETSPQAMRLLNHIEGSVGALDSLFTALLDISRLDAGVIEAAPQVIALRPLLERICRDYEADAAEKGLRLALYAAGLRGYSDPILLERILRNIVSNAVRYTLQGRVLVACRARGDHIAIEVWDTGAGIAAGERETIFQEFFQVANPGRDRSEGLGLGLAIVRRLTALLGHPLALRSTPDVGSVFTLMIPMAEDGAVAAADEPVPTSELNDALILVIDDETAIQEAMGGLLESWGHRVIVAGSSAEMLERIVDLKRSPDLIICDYRLGRENGLAVIERLQQEFNEDIPAMLVTGDTAPDRLAEARASGLLLLHKPVSEARLRATLATMKAGRWSSAEGPVEP